MTDEPSPNAEFSSKAQGARVLHIASGDLWGGAEALVFELVREQCRRSPGTVACIVMNPGALATALAALGVPTTVLDESRQGLGELVRATTAVMRKFSPRVVHSHRQKENLLALLAWMRQGSRRAWIKLVTTVHGMPEPVPGRHAVRRRLVRFANELVLRAGFAAIVAVSQDIAVALRPRFPRNRVLCIYNGISVPAATPATTSTDSQADDRPLRLLALGRLVPIKRFERLGELADAMGQKLRHRPRITLAGDGPLEAQLRQSLALPPRLIHMPGFVSGVEPLLQDTDALVITSDHEGIPMAALEALARGVPVFSFAVGGLREMPCGRTPLSLVTAGDSLALADAIVDYFARRAPGQRQLPPADWRFDIRQCAQSYEDLYASL